MSARLEKIECSKPSEELKNPFIHPTNIYLSTRCHFKLGINKDQKPLPLQKFQSNKDRQLLSPTPHKSIINKLYDGLEQCENYRREERLVERSRLAEGYQGRLTEEVT